MRRYYSCAYLWLQDKIGKSDGGRFDESMHKYCCEGLKIP
jgi:hypothetical protein